jgi:hypothetical protein
MKSGDPKGGKGQRPGCKLAQGKRGTSAALGMSTKNMQSPNGGGTIWAMPQSLARVVLHIAFTTKNRVPFLKEVDLRSRLHAYMAGGLQNIGCEPILINIASQEEHHREVSFQDEFRALCRKHGLEIDERYVWD